MWIRDTNLCQEIFSFFSALRVHLARDVTTEDMKQTKLDVMPGFRFSWWYTGTKVKPDSEYKEEKIIKHFVR